MVGVAQFLPLLIWIVLGGVPMFFVLPKAGFSRWWMLLVVIPMLGIVVLLWILAFSKWSERPVTSEVFS